VNLARSENVDACSELRQLVREYPRVSNEMPLHEFAALMKCSDEAIAEAQRLTLPVYDDDELLELPDPEWDVPGVIPRNSLVQMYGKYGSYKSFIALDLAAHRALGLEWHGLKMKPGPVFYIVAEGAAGMRGRVRGWKKYTGVDYIGIKFIPEAVHLNDVSQVTRLVDAMRRRLSHGAEPWLIVDTRSRCFIGNENSTEDIAAFVRACDRIRRELNATVIVLHHPGWQTAERGRGAYDFDASCDTIIQVEKDAERATLTCTKQKDGPEFAPLAFETLLFAGTRVVKPVEWNAGKLTGKRLDVLRALHHNSTADEGLNYKAWLDHATHLGVVASTFNKTREWLLSSSYVQSREGKWCITDAGRMALNSTNSITTPLTASGARANDSTPLGGVPIPPVVEQPHYLK
jgi:hypothetical protein